MIYEILSVDSIRHVEGMKTATILCVTLCNILTLKSPN